MELKSIVTRWDETARGIKKIPFKEAQKDMEYLISEVRRLERELALSKQDYTNRCQQFEVMHVEIGNVIKKYT